MANPEHVELVKRERGAIRDWRKQNPTAQLDLGGADLSGAYLSRAILSGADLRDAILSRAILSGANLSEANLIRADLSGAYLSGAILSGANLALALLAGTALGDVDLRNVKGLANVSHNGPSPVSTSTLVRTQGEITDDIAKFLQGCGLQPWEIEQAKLYRPGLDREQFIVQQYHAFDKRFGSPLFYGGIFISYSHADFQFVDEIHRRLFSEGANVWLDRHKLQAGGLQKQIDRAIRQNDVVLLVLSKSSTASDWVENELDMARTKEKVEGRDVLCPIALDDSWKSRLDHDESDRALWRTLTKKVILDFSDPKQFDAQFAKLSRGLKINYEKRTPDES